jgi:membrane fusion protein (multidrug efflux system)
VVGEGNKINIRPVNVGERIGSMWIVDGVKPGEYVVVEGLTKIKDGMLVNPKPIKMQPNISKAGA